MKSWFILVTWICAFVLGFILLALIGKLWWDAKTAIGIFGLEFLTATAWDPARHLFGVLPRLYGTLVSSGLALALAVPLGLGVAILLAEPWPFLPRPLRASLIFAVELLAAIPSVVYGLWGIFVLIPALQPGFAWLHHHLGGIPLFSTPFPGRGLLPAALVLAMMILPTIAALGREALAAVALETRWAALAVGATAWETIGGVVLPAARSGIGGAILLAWGRALGETMAVTMLIGNANRLSPSLLAPADTIASLLANNFAEAQDLEISALMYAALVLLAMTLLVNGIGEWLLLGISSSQD